MENGFIFKDGRRVVYRVEWLAPVSWLSVRLRSGHWSHLRKVEEGELEGFMASEIPAADYARSHDLVAIKDGLGHQSLKTTSIYLHASMEAGCPVEEMEIALPACRELTTKRSQYTSAV